MSYTQETTIVDGEPLLSKHQEIVRVCIEDFMKNNIN